MSDKTPADKLALRLLLACLLCLGVLSLVGWALWRLGQG